MPLLYLAGSGSDTYFAYERSLTKPIEPDNQGRALELPQMTSPEVLFGTTNVLKLQSPGFAHCRPINTSYQALDALYLPGVIFQMTVSNERPNSKDDGMMNQLRLAVTEWWGVPAEGKKHHVYYVVPESNFASFTLQNGKLLDLIQDPNVPCPESCANLKQGCGCRYVKFFEFHVLGIPWFCKPNLDQFRIPEDASIFRMDLDARIVKGDVSVSEYYKTRGAGMQQGIRISEAIEQQHVMTALEKENAEPKKRRQVTQII